MQELPDRKRVGAPSSDRALAGQVLEEADHVHLEVDLGVDPRLAALGRVHLVERSSETPDLVPELALGQGRSSIR
jgi:hypothetical protein